MPEENEKKVSFKDIIVMFITVLANLMSLFPLMVLLFFIIFVLGGIKF